MITRTRMWLCTLSLVLFIPFSAYGQEMSAQAGGRNVAEMKFTSIPGLPTCGTGSVQSGDPAKGPSIILAKMTAGCTIPWHWHSPTEHVMLVSGVAQVEMKDSKPLQLQAGGYAMLPSRHVHQFRCEQACLLYVHSDGPFDIHYVDAKGNEIPPADALKMGKPSQETSKPR